MKDKIILADYIVSADAKHTIYKDCGIEIVNGTITNIKKYTLDELRAFAGEVEDYSGNVIIPGFIQTHIHLCQTLFRGFADDLLLLDWLQKRIFPFENAHNKKSLRLSASLGICELLLSGTTTIMDMGTLRHQEVIFKTLIKSGIRAFAGKCMIDQNDLLPEFKSTTEKELDETYRLAEQFHNANNGLIKYAFAPRFVLSCSEKLLKKTKDMMSLFEGSLYHTHASENTAEIEVVRQMHNKENIEYFDSIGVLDDRAVLAHCIHLNENEIDILKEKDVRVSHCPSSNLKLGSGIAPIPTYLKKGINVSIGADGAPCNNSLDMFKEMHLASLIQKPIHGPTSMDAETTFRLATIEGAKALHIDNITGSLEVGKKADLVCLNLSETDQPVYFDENNIYSLIVYSGNKNLINSVMVDGKWLVEEGFLTRGDEYQIFNDASIEYKKLLKRL